MPAREGKAAFWTLGSHPGPADLDVGSRSEARPASQHDLGTWLGLEKGTVSRLVAGLFTEGSV